MEAKGFTVAVFSGELRSRLAMTIKCINSINDQTHQNLQKILVNGGSPPHQTKELIDAGVSLDDWTILDFPIDCMDIKENNWNAHKWNGAAALNIANKEFFFAINDDDFIANDFFTRISRLLLKHPRAKTAIGLRVPFYHNSGRYGQITLPRNKEGGTRPEYEPGINPVREIFFRGNLGYGPSLGFQPICDTKAIREIGPSFFYKGFYPDCGPYFQIVSRFDMVFDPEAYMYWGIHENQDHKKWEVNNYWYCAHEKVYTEFMKDNIAIFRKNLPDNLKDIKCIEKYFKTRIVSTSFFAMTSRYLRRSFPTAPKRYPKPIKFPIFKHCFIILKRPLVFINLLCNLFVSKSKS
jgi:hypothetical protein